MDMEGWQDAADFNITVWFSWYEDLVCKSDEISTIFNCFRVGHFVNIMQFKMKSVEESVYWYI